MNGGSLLAYVFTDLNFSPAISAAADNPGNLNGSPSLTFPPGGETVMVTINDDDGTLDDDFQEGAGINQMTMNDVILDDGTVLGVAGDIIEVEFFITYRDTVTGEEFDVFFGAFGADAAGSDAGLLTVVFTEVAFVPGRTYDFVSATDGGGVPYTNLICFAEGSLIATPQGPRPVETLVPGDLVTTQDNGDQPVRWAGHRRVSAAEQAMNSSLAPIRIEAGALGPGLPEVPLCLSPQHRVLLSGAQCELMFGSWSVLVPAKSLINDRTIRPTPTEDSIGFYHLLFDRHEIIFANGSPCESLHGGPEALSSLTSMQIRQVEALFGARPDSLRENTTAHPCLKHYEAKSLRLTSA
ncbi:MAG: Hint domain-containing protein [Pseudomonadota bacterium]